MRAILRASDPEVLEVMLGVLAIVFGVFLLMPWDTWDRPCSYDLVEDIYRREWVMGVVWCAQGVAQVVLAKLWRLRLLTERAFVGVFGAAMWGTMLATLLVCDPRSTGMPIYSMLVVASLWVSWRVGVIEQRVSASWTD